MVPTPYNYLIFNTPIKRQRVACKTRLESHLTTLQAPFKCVQKYIKLILVPNDTTVLPKPGTKFSTSSRKTNYRKQGGTAADSTHRRSDVTRLTHSFLDEYFWGNNFTPQFFFQKGQTQSPLSSFQLLQKSPKIWKTTLRGKLSAKFNQ